MSPEQQNFIENFYNMFDSGGVHKKIVNVEPLCFQGKIAGTEFLTYSANKLYLCYKLLLTYNNGIAEITSNQYDLLDENNADAINIMSSYIMWIGTQVEYAPVLFRHENIYFSRISTIVGFNGIIINGYRVTLN
jgi:hypothetical protein